MRRWDGRLVCNVIGICLPTVTVVLGGIYFFIVHVPEIIRNEQHRVQSVYRDYALELKADPSVGFERPRGKGGAWAKDRRMAPGYWGVVVGPDGGCPSVGEVPPGRCLVWYLDDKDVCHVRCESKVEEIDFRLIFLLGGPFLLAVLVMLTLVGVRYFVRYVKSRDDFLAATAHDLTTPLVGLRMMIGRDDDEAKRLNERMLLIVSNIKDFLKLGGKRREPEPKPIDIVALTKEAYRLFAADYEDSESGAVVFDSGRLPSTAVEVLADETMALQILWNLFGNDLKYAAPYGKVAVRFVREAGFVKVEFVDEGPGMTPRQMKKAFDRYYRAQTVLESGKGGFGIGLCTAREFARAMGGDLAVRANAPKGCVFALTLPAQGCQNPDSVTT